MPFSYQNIKTELKIFFFVEKIQLLDFICKFSNFQNKFYCVEKISTTVRESFKSFRGVEKLLRRQVEIV